MEFWTPRNLGQLLHGRWLVEPRDPAGVSGGVAGVSTDSRGVRPGQAFIALRGEKFDGNEFAGAVAKAGASVVVVSDEAKARASLAAACGDALPAPLSVLLVSDTLAALQRLASAYRDALENAGVKVIAVAGSNGKTTTRNLIH